MMRSLLMVAFTLLFCGVTGAAVFNPDGATHDPTSQSGWALPPPPSVLTDFNNCLGCHRPGGIAPDRSSYLFGGHKNMARPADGMKWGMPGVDAGHPFLGDSEEASVGADGSFLSLWIQEEYPRLPVDWTMGSGAAASSVTLAYCAKDATGAIGSDDVPDLMACPTCESPDMGNGNAGYPLNYPDQATCEAAAMHSGKPYTWITPSTAPLYWIYGGAGLEGGPPMAEPGSQPYKCGRCHTTGWTANHTADDITTKHPQVDFPSVDFKTLTAIGTSTLVLRPSTAGDSATDVSSWDQWGIECSRCHVATDGSHATWPTASTHGGDVVGMCMSCHRMESDTAPRVNSNQNGYTADTFAATVFTNKQQQPDGLAHHPDGNEFLNSPHAKFTGTTFGSMGCPPYAINGYGPSITPYAPGAPTECTPGTMNLDGATTSLYTSKFAQAAKVDLVGISDTAAGSCVTCHDVHQPLNENVTGMSQSVVVGCTDCHASASATVTPQINLATIHHPEGVGTPLEHLGTDPQSACATCHAPSGLKHIWRISTDATYTTYGDYTYAYPVNGAGAVAAAKNVNLSHTAPDGTYANAVWIDLDNACGQCHGGGIGQTDFTTTGSITAGSTDGLTINPLTVADPTGFESGREVTIAGAGIAGADFKTVIARVTGTTVYLTYPAVTSVTGAVVTVSGNPPSGGAPYKTRAQLASAAVGMHNSAWTTTTTSTTNPTSTSTTLVTTSTTTTLPEGLIPGGGPTKSDCYAELAVRGIENPSERVKNNKIVLCTDGEACDTGPCGDNTCNINIRLCINQSDPNLPDCTAPSGLDSVKVKAQGKLKLNVAAPQLLQGAQCGSSVSATVPVKVNKKGQVVGAGKAKLKIDAKAPKGTKPRTDGDTITVECLPRTVACPQANPSKALERRPRRYRAHG